VPATERTWKHPHVADCLSGSTLGSAVALYGATLELARVGQYTPTDPLPEPGKGAEMGHL